jgi:hypothetical protein
MVSRHTPCHLRQRSQRWSGFSPEHNFVAPARDGHLFAGEPKRLGQAHRLAAAVLEKLGRFHGYEV